MGLDGMVEDTHGGDRNSISLRDLVFFGEWQKERVREAKHRLMWAMWRSHLREHSLSSIEANFAKRFEACALSDFHAVFKEGLLVNALLVDVVAPNDK